MKQIFFFSVMLFVGLEVHANSNEMNSFKQINSCAQSMEMGLAFVSGEICSLEAVDSIKDVALQEIDLLLNQVNLTNPMRWSHSRLAKKNIEYAALYLKIYWLNVYRIGREQHTFTDTKSGEEMTLIQKVQTLIQNAESEIEFIY